MKRKVLLLLALLLAALLAVMVCGCGKDDDTVPIQQAQKNETDAIPARVNAAWAKDVLTVYDKYDEYYADAALDAALGADMETTVEAEAVAFFTDREVTGFKVMALEFEEADENGNIVFSAETLYRQKRLMPERPLVVTAPFYGTIPGWGISYRDADGRTRSFAVTVSGEDGSVLLEEITI